MADLQLDLNQSLELRIAQFKNDPEKINDVNDFLDELINEAQVELEHRNKKTQGKAKLMVPKELGLPSPGLKRRQGPLHQEYSPQFVIAQIKLKVLSTKTEKRTGVNKNVFNIYIYKEIFKEIIDGKYSL
ncbi:unnamed protein product [Brassicogethes aeneus]|uniref:Uncharacterized protein n=1 Tax=Brassicogethes aeneus TaxID=1431903 RepID=A0A9P0BBZ7_BRAAE|nr:unnamed protein product [Brassicogethes aeneus]